MPDTPSPDAPPGHHRHEPQGRLASAARELTGGLRIIAGLTAAQAFVLAAFLALVFSFCVAGYVIYIGPKTMNELNAANMRVMAELSERTREENRLRDEKFLAAQEREAERNRAAQSEISKVLMAAILELTKETVKLQTHMNLLGDQASKQTEAMKQLQEEITGLRKKLNPAEIFDLVPPCPVAPMPRVLTRR